MKVVTFAGTLGDPSGLVTFEANSTVDAVVAAMYRVFELGRQAALDQVQKSKAQSERNPNRNAEWRKIRETDPPAEALISTSTPAGDPNSLLRAGNKLRLPDVRDRIIVRPRTLPKAAPAPVTPQGPWKSNTIRGGSGEGWSYTTFSSTPVDAGSRTAAWST